MLKSLMGVFIKDPEPESLDTQERPRNEIADLMQARLRDGPEPPRQRDDQPLEAETGPVLTVGTSSVQETQAALQTMISATLPALAAFRNVYDSLEDLPGPSRFKAALKTTASAMKFPKEAVVKDMQEALKKLELHAQEFLQAKGKEERAAIGGKSGHLEEISAALTRLRQEQEKLEADQAATTADIEEANRTFSEQRAHYDVASKTTIGDIQSLLAAITKSP